ncbi:DNA mismatch repair endonuclease MutL [Niabella terrae]
MPDKIVLLPDNIANQIAAGEVIQRPASAVKELMENAVDAGATEIKVLIADAGKSLLQVIDNGCGMSEADARVCFDRHATSKIKQIEDLFHISTMGFRGEALASIAAVAEVELKTKRPDDEAGHFLRVANSRIQSLEPVAVPEGTSIAMKNLFFNIPARRNFLKSNASEMRHIIDEFTRVALAFPEIQFSLTSNGQQVFYLEKGNLKQRILQLLGNNYNAKMVAVKEETDYMNIYGFTGKPETARKTRGDQYFFINNRFIRSPYLHHAVMNAYQEMLPAGSFPMYVLFIELDPEQVDVNVHPTKQEIKFEDEKIIYAFVQAAIKHALAQFSITPTLDFDLDARIQQLPAVSQPFTSNKQQEAAGSDLYKGFTRKHQAHFIEKPAEPLQDWKDFYAPLKEEDALFEYEKNPPPSSGQLTALPQQAFEIDEHTDLLQVLKTYILIGGEQSFLLIHQQAAHERVLYQQMSQAAADKPIATQSTMFPVTIDLIPADAGLLQELLPYFGQLGYLIEPAGGHRYLIQGTPADLEPGDEKQVIDFTLEQYKHFSSDIRISEREKLIRSLARQRAVKTGIRLTQREMRQLVRDLFQCQPFNTAPDGSPTYLEFKEEQIEKMFGRL